LDIGDGVQPCSEVRFDLSLYDDQAELPSFKLTEDELHTKLLHMLKFDEFYDMVAFSIRWCWGYDLPSSTESITLPSIWISGDWADFKSDQLLAVPFPNHLTPNEIYMQPWECYPLQYESMPTGWTRWVSELLWTIILMEVIARVEYQDNPNLDSHHLAAHVKIEYPAASVEKWWLSQQAYVYKHLQGVIGGSLREYLTDDWLNVCFRPSRRCAITICHHHLFSLHFGLSTRWLHFAGNIHDGCTLNQGLSLLVKPTG
jgi:hypothetical protein